MSESSKIRRTIALLALTALACAAWFAWDRTSTDLGAMPHAAEREAAAPRPLQTDMAGQALRSGTPESVAPAGVPANGLTGRDAATVDPTTAAMVLHVEETTSGLFAGVPGERLPVANLARQFAELAAKARDGDLTAARALYNAAKECKRSPRTPEDLAKRTMHDGESGPEIAAGDAIQRRRYTFCSGATDEMLASVPRWAEQLADAGDPVAQLQYQNDVALDGSDPAYQQQLNRARERAMSYLQQQLQGGNPQALFSLQSYYSANRLVSRDPYRAYVYGWAYVLAMGERLPPAHAAFLGLASAETQLTAAQLESARSEGVMLQKKCCGG